VLTNFRSGTLEQLAREPLKRRDERRSSHGDNDDDGFGGETRRSRVLRAYIAVRARDLARRARHARRVDTLLGEHDVAATDVVYDGLVRVVVLWLVITACNRTTDGGGPLSLPDRFKQSQCTRLVSCGVFSDIATCMATEISDRDGVDLDAAIRAGLATVDDAKLQQCLDALAALSCDNYSLERRIALRQCFEAEHGTIGAGGACGNNVECTSQSCLIPACASACCQGTCEGDGPPTVGAIGDTCGGAVICDVDAYCDTMTKQCTAAKTNSARCTSDDECVAPLMCTQTEGSPSRLCLATPVLCQTGCRSIAERCQTPISSCVKSATLGQRCASDAECYRAFYCNQAGVCARGELGDPCSFARDCGAAGTYCDLSTMRCEAAKPDGAACTFFTECQSRTCSGLVCGACT
jgi:hypothetical protein